MCVEPSGASPDYRIVLQIIDFAPACHDGMSGHGISVVVTSHERYVVAVDLHDGDDPSCRREVFLRRSLSRQFRWFSW